MAARVGQRAVPAQRAASWRARTINRGNNARNVPTATKAAPRQTAVVCRKLRRVVRTIVRQTSYIYIGSWRQNGEQMKPPRQ